MASLSRKIGTLKEHVGRFGWPSAVHVALARPLERWRLLRVGYCLALDIRNPLRPPGDLPSGAEVRELRLEEVGELAQSETDWFFPGAVAASLERGDRCFAVLIDGVVACSNWCATAPLLQFGLVLQPPVGGFFGHRLFTKPAHRGRKLQAFLRAHVADHYRALGYEWYLNTMFWTNTASLHAAERLGYRRVATILAVGPEDRPYSRLLWVRPPGVSVI